MKLVINTQYRENYAAHNEDFVPGISENYWKFKGGSTYVVPHTDKVCESWETITTFTFNKDERQFYFMKVTDNREDGYMRSEILEKTETWVGTSGAGRKFYKAEFLMNDGDIILQDELSSWIETSEAA